MFGLSGVELSQRALRDPLQHLLGENSHQLPADVQGFVHGAVFVSTCKDERGRDISVQNMDALGKWRNYGNKGCLFKSLSNHRWN